MIRVCALALVIAGALSSPSFGTATQPIVLADFLLVQVMDTGELRGMVVPMFVYEGGTYRNAFVEGNPTDPARQSILNRVTDFVLYDDQAKRVGTSHVASLGWGTDGPYGCTSPFAGFGTPQLSQTPKFTETFADHPSYPQAPSQPRAGSPPMQLRVVLLRALSQTSGSRPPHPFVVSSNVPEAVAASLSRIARSRAADFVRTHPYISYWPFQERGFPLAVKREVTPVEPLALYQEGNGERRVVGVFRVESTRLRHDAQEAAELHVVVAVSLPPAGAARTLMSLVAPSAGYPANDEYHVAGVYDLAGNGSGAIVLTHVIGESAHREIFTSSGQEFRKIGETESWGC